MTIIQSRAQEISTPHVCPIRRAGGRRRVVCECAFARGGETPVATAPARPWGELPNWHVTWCGGATSDGPAACAPGAYPADEDEGSAASVVAPAAFVTAYAQERNPEGRFPGTPADAVRAWARQQGFYCA